MEDKNDKIWVTVSTTVNLGNFENIKIEMGQSITIEEGQDDPEVTRKSLLNSLLKDIQRKAKQIKRIKNEQRETEE